VVNCSAAIFHPFFILSCFAKHSGKLFNGMDVSLFAENAKNEQPAPRRSAMQFRKNIIGNLRESDL